MSNRIKVEWQVFVNEYLASDDHIGAYQKAYPGSDRKLAATRGKRLLNVAAIQKVISESRNRKKTLVNEVRDKEIIEAAKGSVISELEVDKVLSQIITGKHQVERVFIIRNQPIKIKVGPEHNDILSAIDKYYKRYGSYAPNKVSIADPFKDMSDDELKALLKQKQAEIDDED
ncbi:MULTISPECIES: terminase small subunit [unclassified Paraflavitalea]|uniref:terminase small subunit n=1 Tax=unclassified Paraflavitalea TaxID=2798305 RepID=UPI003D33525D